jgi:hypothetical protein
MTDFERFLSELKWALNYYDVEKALVYAIESVETHREQRAPVTFSTAIPRIND